MAEPVLPPPARGQVRFLALAVAAGLGGGVVAVLFRALSIQLPAWIWPGDPNLVRGVAAAPDWRKIAVPVVGALLAGLVLYLGSRWTVVGKGWDILEAVVLRDGVLHLRAALVKGISSLLTVASAAPLGREGPMVQLAAATCSWGARRMRLPVRQRRILVACGVAAGMAAAYNAPIGAALFTMEVIVGNFALEVFAPLVFASVVATMLARAAFSGTPVFQLGGFKLVSPWEFAAYLALGVLAGLTAALFLRGLRASSALFRKSRLPRPLAMAIAGLLLGVVVLFVPDVVGNGREAIVLLFREDWVPGFALMVLLLRVVLTSAEVGSGAVGGVFTPTLFIGAVLGDAFGSALQMAFPQFVGGPKAYALVGMGCLLAGTTHAPITAVLMLFEMTLDYNIVLPLLLGASAASLVARSIDDQSIYTEALRRKRGAPTPRGEAAAMAKLTVSDVMRAEHRVVPADTPLPRLLDTFIHERRNHLYIEKDGAFAGAVSLYEASRALREAADPASLCARDVANPSFQTTTPEERLDRTLERFWTQECERLPVLDRATNGKVIGTVSKRDILGVYSLEILHRRSLLARFDEDLPGARPTYVELPEDHIVDESSVPPELVGLTFSEARVRERYGVSVLILRRMDERGRPQRLIPEGRTRLEAGDRVVVFGAREKVEAFLQAGRR